MFDTFHLALYSSLFASSFGLGSLKKIDIACVDIGFKGCYPIFVNCIVISIYPHHTFNQFSPVLSNDCLGMLTSCYHLQ